jgi:hypothetical protein
MMQEKPNQNRSEDANKDIELVVKGGTLHER